MITVRSKINSIQQYLVQTLPPIPFARRVETFKRMRCRYNVLLETTNKYIQLDLVKEENCFLGHWACNLSRLQHLINSILRIYVAFFVAIKYDVTIIILIIVNRPLVYLKHGFSENGFCLRP
jgi:hypothetical protein